MDNDSKKLITDFSYQFKSQVYNYPYFSISFEDNLLCVSDFRNELNFKGIKFMHTSGDRDSINSSSLIIDVQSRNSGNKSYSNKFSFNQDKFSCNYRSLETSLHNLSHSYVLSQNLAKYLIKNYKSDIPLKFFKNGLVTLAKDTEYELFKKVFPKAIKHLG